MSIASTVYDVLANYGGLTALVSTRIYAKQRPQGSALPAVIHGIVATVPENTNDRGAVIDHATVQIDAWSDDYEEALAVFAQVRAAMDAAGFYLVSGPMDFYNAETATYRYGGDFSVWV